MTESKPRPRRRSISTEPGQSPAAQAMAQSFKLAGEMRREGAQGSVELAKVRPEPNRKQVRSSLVLTLGDVVNGIDAADPLRDIKTLQLEEVTGLASSIRTVGGLIEAIVVYPQGDFYNIIAGERRWLAMNVLALEDASRWNMVDAFIKRSRPSELMLHRIQTIENRQRIQLTLLETVEATRRTYNIIEETGEGEFTVDVVMSDLSVKKSQAYVYMNAARLPAAEFDVLRDAIAQGVVDTFKALEAAVSERSPAKRRTMLESGSTAKAAPSFKASLPAAPAQRLVELGARELAGQGALSEELRRKIDDCDWGNHKAATRVFKEFLKSWEAAYGE